MILALWLQVAVAPAAAESGEPLRRAIEAARGKPTELVLQAGTYRLTEPLLLGPEHSGLKIVAAEGARPVVSGGLRIAGWKEAGGGLWSAPVPPGLRFRELFVNGVRRPRARHPNGGFLRVVKAGPDRRTSFRVNASDLPALDGGELAFLHDWSVSRVAIRSVDPAAGTLATLQPIGAPSDHYAIDHFEAHPRYFVENARALLDAPGEWFHDEAANALLYRPPDGEPIREAAVPVSPGLLAARGVKGLLLKGITFEHSAWPLPAGGYAEGQATSHEDRGGPGGGRLVPAALEFLESEGCRLEECVLRRLGGGGLRFGSRSRDCALVESLVTDVSGNGVMLGEEASRRVGNDPWWKAAPDEAASGNRVERCLIERCGRQFFGAVGVWVGLARDTLVARNEVRDLPYTGISVGWMWNPTPTPCRGNVVEANHIHHAMQTLSDGGGIYTLGRQPGGVLRANHIHDVPANAGRAESNGMFLDEGTTDLLIEGNLFHAIARAPLRFHQATTNRVRANRFFTAPGVGIVTYNSTDAANIAYEANTISEGPADPTKEPVAGAAGPPPAVLQRLLSYP